MIFEHYPFFIAEVGVNHNGDIATAKELIDAAVDARCHAVKFQNWFTDLVYSETESIKPEYQKIGTDANESEYSTIKALELSTESLLELKQYCDKKGIIFFSTPDEWKSAKILIESLDVPYIKIGSQDVTNLPFIRKLADSGKTIILSTGASSFSEVALAVEQLESAKGNYCLLHCVSSYPAPLRQMNLKAIPALSAFFGCPIGFSDHTRGVIAAGAALALGAVVFEKHISLSVDARGPDHLASATPSEMKDYTERLSELAEGLGDGIKKIEKCEEENRRAFSRFLVAAHPLEKGTVLSEDDFLLKKVQTGLKPVWGNFFVGKRLKKDIQYEHKFSLSDLDLGDL